MDHEATKRFPQKTVKYVTVDIKDERNPNVFDPNGSYIHKHKQNFDVIFLPDCGGEWYPSSNDDEAERYKLIKNVMSMLKLWDFCTLVK
jgi:hypothetical protein